MHSDLVADIQELCGERAAIEVITNFTGFATESDNPSIEPLMDILEARLGSRPEPTGARYFTDASALVPGFDNVAAVIRGPGKPRNAIKRMSSAMSIKSRTL